MYSRIENTCYKHDFRKRFRVYELQKSTSGTPKIGLKNLRSVRN